MDPVSLLLRVVLLPAGVCFGARLLAGFAAPRAERVREAIAAFGVAVALVASLYAMGIRPSLPLAISEDAWEWVFWLAPAAAVVGIAGVLGSGVRAPEVAKFVVRWALATGAAWLVVRALVPHAATASHALGRAAAAGFAAECLWSAIASRAKRGGGLVGILPLAPPLIGSAGIFHEIGASYVMACAAGALATAVGVTGVLGRRDPAPLPRAAAPVVAIVFACLLLGAHSFLNYGEAVKFPWETAVLLAAAVTCIALPKPWLATALSVLLTGAAAYLAIRLGTAGDAAYGF